MARCWRCPAASLCSAAPRPRTARAPPAAAAAPPPPPWPARSASRAALAAAAARRGGGRAGRQSHRRAAAAQRRGSAPAHQRSLCRRGHCARLLQEAVQEGRHVCARLLVVGRQRAPAQGPAGARMSRNRWPQGGAAARLEACGAGPQGPRATRGRLARAAGPQRAQGPQGLPVPQPPHLEYLVKVAVPGALLTPHCSAVTWQPCAPDKAGGRRQRRRAAPRGRAQRAACPPTCAAAASRRLSWQARKTSLMGSTATTRPVGPAACAGGRQPWAVGPGRPSRRRVPPARACARWLALTQVPTRCRCRQARRAHLRREAAEEADVGAHVQHSVPRPNGHLRRRSACSAGGARRRPPAQGAPAAVQPRRRQPAARPGREPRLTPCRVYARCS
jgi:hypothetical protein